MLVTLLAAVNKDLTKISKKEKKSYFGFSLKGTAHHGWEEMVVKSRGSQGSRDRQ